MACSAAYVRATTGVKVRKCVVCDGLRSPRFTGFESKPLADETECSMYMCQEQDSTMTKVGTCAYCYVATRLSENVDSE